MRSLAALAQARSEYAELDPEEEEALSRFEALSNLRPLWTPTFPPALLAMRCSPAAALLAASAAQEHSGASKQYWSLWARPWGCRGLSSSEVWLETMRECFEAGLMVGEAPARIVDRAGSVARLGPRLVAMIEGRAWNIEISIP